MKWLGYSLFLVLIGGAGVYLYVNNQNQQIETQELTPVTISVINTPTPEIEEEIDKIVLEYPQQDQLVESPLKFKGIAKGGWFFEGSFPVVLTNWDGLIIGQGLAKAKGDWMSNEVEFEGELDFDVPSYGESGFLILKKDNPSGLPENDDSFEIRVKFN